MLNPSYKYNGHPTTMTQHRLDIENALQMQATSGSPLPLKKPSSCGQRFAHKVAWPN
jgi:hypothetical protein